MLGFRLLGGRFLVLFGSRSFRYIIIIFLPVCLLHLFAAPAVDYLLVAAELAPPLEGRVADAVAPEATVAGVVVLPVAALVAVLALQAALLADV